MRKFVLLLMVGISGSLAAQDLSTPFERSQGKQTATYAEIVSWWKKIDQYSDIIRIFEKGMTDAELPLQLVMVSPDKDFNFESLHRKQKCILLINNGIHPGEPDGIDASMLLVRDIVRGKIQLPPDLVLAIIPVYNIGGCLNRSTFYRVDQNGPEAFGFRGNSQNLDLNRDFIKSDSREARLFATIFHEVDPDLFIDNHVSDGADYQHIMSLLSTQHNKLGGPLGEFLDKELEPAMYSLMKAKGYDLVPYVNAFGDTPESGWPQFLDVPRFSSGYAALWGTIGFMPETHMLKPFAQRVQATYALMSCFLQYAHENASKIRSLREQTKAAVARQTEFNINWASDRSGFREITFEGYAALHKPSLISGQPRLYYDRTQPFEKKVKFYDQYKPTLTIKKPFAYIIPQGWWKVIELLRINRVQMKRLSKDTAIEVEVYRISSYQSSPRAYEGHHLNTDVQLAVSKETMHFRKGDLLIPMDQPANRYLAEVLEPQGEDSFFAWNFFDPILGQKEGYSSYAFEETAADYLASHPELKARLDERKSGDSAFAKNGAAQLDFVFKNSPYFEPDYLRYPVYRVVR